MNLKRGFRRITLVLAITGGILCAVSAIFFVSQHAITANDYLQEKRFAYLNEYGLETFTKDGIRFLPDKPTPTQVYAYKVELKRRAEELTTKIQAGSVRLSVIEELNAIKQLKELENSFWVDLPYWGLIALCILSGLTGASLGYFSIWVVVWFGGLAAYRLVRWIVLGFHDSSDLDIERKSKGGVR